MPGRQTVTHAGIQFRVALDFWLRRLLRFPFYFESTNPSFRVDIKRLSEKPNNEAFPNDAVIFEVVFADGTKAKSLNLRLPDLKVGESIWIAVGNVFTAHPGQSCSSVRT